MTETENGGCPFTREAGGGATLAQRFDPFHDPYLADPYPLLAEARRREPVFYSPDLDYWVVTRYADIEAVFKDPETYSARIAQAPIAPLAPSVVQLLKEARFAPEPVMSNCDRPKHTRIRRHTARAFTSNKVAVLEPFIRGLADRAIDAFAARGRADLVAEMLYDLPASVILKILGIPDGDVPKIKSWSSNRLMLTWGRLGEAEQLREARGLLEYWRYCEGHIAAKIAVPGDDFPSDLLAIRNGDDAVLTIPEITNIVFGLLIAGHETTTSSSANAVKTLLGQRHAWERLCREPAAIPAAVEELLRFDTSVISWRRQANRPVRIAGVDIPEGGKLLLMLASANRDDSVFPEPERLDLDRANARDHLSFGLGIHFCFGAPLARLELKVILEQLTSRLAGLHLVEGQTWRFPANTSFRGPVALEVRW
jgi:cytochrome P450